MPNIGIKNANKVTFFKMLKRKKDLNCNSDNRLSSANITIPYKIIYQLILSN